jgi:hypothetical protein
LGWKKATCVQPKRNSSDATDLDTNVAGGRVRLNVPNKDCRNTEKDERISYL